MSSGSGLWPIVQGMGLLVLGWFGYLVARQQALVAHNRLKLDLFEKRLAIVRQMREAVGSIISSGKVEQTVSISFARALYDGVFLFSKPVWLRLKSIYDHIGELDSINAEAEATTRDSGIFHRRRKVFGEVESFFKILENELADEIRPSVTDDWLPSQKLRRGHEWVTTKIRARNFW